MIFSTAIARPLQLVTRTLQWSSAVIVMGLTSYFIKQGPKGQHIIYQEVIVRPVVSRPLVSCKIYTSSRDLTFLLGGPLRRILPSSLYLALLANRTEQVRPAH